VRVTDDETNPPVSARTVFGWCVAGALGVLLVLVTALVAYQVRDLLVQMLVALFIAVSLDPLVRLLIRRRVKRSIAVTAILLVFLVAIGGLVWLAMPPLLEQATKLTSDFPGYLDTLRHRSPGLAELEARFNLKPKVDDFAATFLERIQKEGLAFGQRFLGALVSTLLVVVLTVYFMLDLPRLRRAAVGLFPLRHRPRAAHGVNVMVDKVGAYMIGNIVISVIAGVTSFLALFLLDVPFALPLAVFVAITDLIPLIGASLGAVVCIVAAIATTDLWPNAVLVFVFFLAYQQLENYLIAPFVLRNSVDMPSVAVLLVALVGASVLGLVGALMVIPIAAAVKVLATPMMRARDTAQVGEKPDPPGPPTPPADREPGTVEPGTVELGTVEPGTVEPGTVEPVADDKVPVTAVPVTAVPAQPVGEAG
jgi:predicted PurR-regulated permease PerM